MVTGVLGQGTGGAAAAVAVVRILKCDWQGKPKDKDESTDGYTRSWKNVTVKVRSGGKNKKMPIVARV